MQNLILKSLLVATFSLGISAKIVDLREYQTPVKNQKDRNTCAYFAVTALMESTIKVRFNKSFDISEQFQIYYGKEYFNEYTNQEHGSTYEIARNFAKQYFFVKESDIPYQLSYFEKGRQCENEDPYSEATPSVCFAHGPYNYTDFNYVGLSGLQVDWLTGMWSSWLSRAELIQKNLDDKRPVVITFKVYPPLWDNAHVTYTEETEKKCNDGTYSCYGHAVLLTGYDSEKKIFTFKNSWGTSWGNEGYGTVSYDYVNKFSDMPVTMYFERLIGDIREK